ncbi:MAG: FHA domain-containing protein [Myxococcales bacterium]|nr:FHA domain-containing protein [Myxococcales bacterium]
MPSLRILSGSLENQEIELTPDPMTVGRSSACNIRIGDAGVSSKHAKIWCEDGEYYLMDLGSTNGTFVNDKDVDRERLNDGDVITFGMTKAAFVGEKPKARVNPARAAPGRPGTAPVQRPVPGRGAPPSGRGGAAPATAEDTGDQEPVPDGIVTDQPRPRAQPGLRKEVKTQDEVEIATLRGKVAFYEEENRKLKAQIVKVQEQSAHEAAAGARADAEKIRGLLKQREEEMKKLQKELDEKETYYSPAELERERKRMEAAIEADRRRETETLQRQLKELEHRVAIRGAESETVARQLKEKDDLIKMLSEREDEVQAEIKARDARVQAMQDEMKAAKDSANAAAGKEKELNDKLKQKNAQLAQLGKERGELVQELAKARQIIAKVGGAEEAAAAVEEQHRATQQMQDRIVALEAEVTKAKDAASVIGGKLDTAESKIKDLEKQLQEAEAQMTDALDAKMKVDSQLSELLRKSGSADQHEKQLAMLKADRDARASEAQGASEALASAEAQLAKIRGTYDDIIHERDELKAKVEAMSSDARMAGQASQLQGDWEARYKSANEELNDVKKQLSRMKIELQQAREAAAKGGGGGATVDEGLLKLIESRADLHNGLVTQMLEGVNNAVSLLRRNSELLKGYVEDCGLLANAVRKIDYTRLEPEQQQMLVELIDQTQPDVIVKNMQGIGDENSESIVKAKKLILDYSDAFKKEDAQGAEIDNALAKAQGLFHATDPDTDIPVKIEAVLPPVEAGKEEAVLFAFALLRETKQFTAEDAGAPGIKIDTDGLTITFTSSPLDPKIKERYRDPPDAQSRLLRGFAHDRCGGKLEVKEEEGKTALVITLKAKI